MVKKQEGAVLKTMTMPLAVKLTDEERLDRGAKLAATLEDIGNEKVRQGMVKKQLQSDMAALEDQRDRLKAAISRGTELRGVDCEDRVISGRVHRVRLDTMEVIHERSLTDEERQLELVTS